MRSIPRDPDFVRRLLHRWFVTYNPLYLVSAMLVLVGLQLTSAGVARDGGVHSLGVPLLAELYSFTLLGGIAVLLRRGLTRSAVQLALLVVLYQGDLTLHTETCALAGRGGLPLALAWLGLFGAKLAWLARMFGLRLRARTRATVAVGAGTLALLPFATLGGYERGVALGAAVFVLGALVPRSIAEAVTPRIALDAWGTTVLRRVVVAAFATWGTAFALHVLFWSTHRAIDPVPIVVAVVSVIVARRRSELRVWAAVGAGVIVAGEHRPVVAAFAACTLLVRAFSEISRDVEVEAPATDEPYRADPPAGRVRRVRVEVLEPVAFPERLRLLTGALFSTYLSVWSSPRPLAVAFPQHLLWLDVALVVGATVLAVYGGRLVLAGTAALLVHGFFVAEIVTLPATAAGWGVTTLVAGFAVLIGSVLGTTWIAGRAPAAPDPEPAPDPQLGQT